MPPQACTAPGRGKHISHPDKPLPFGSFSAFLIAAFFCFFLLPVRVSFPDAPPALSPKAYLYRKIFEEFFPTPAAADTVPMGKSIACSTARALEWDESFKV